MPADSDPARPRIMVVDDEEGITVMLKLGLEKEGFVVTTFNDPLLALSSFKAGQYDMLLLDIRMPKMDGFTFYQKIQEIDSNAKVCFMTAYEIYFDSIKEMFPDSYPDMCIIKKPLPMNDFAKRIRKEMARSHTGEGQ